MRDILLKIRINHFSIAALVILKSKILGDKKLQFHPEGAILDSIVLIQVSEWVSELMSE